MLRDFSCFDFHKTTEYKSWGRWIRKPQSTERRQDWKRMETKSKMQKKEDGDVAAKCQRDDM